ncbi:MAG: polysaccharide biosynthesis C-terminal domain-containing protein [Parvibaculaceae bacterium]
MTHATDTPSPAGLRHRAARLASKVSERIGRDEETRESAWAAAKVLFIRCAGAALAYITQVLLARLLGQSDYGIFALVWVWILVLGHLTPLGIAQAVCRFVPHYHARDEQELLRGFLKFGAGFVALFSFGVAILGALALWIAAPWMTNVYVLPFAIALLVFPLFALQDYVENIARAFNWTIIAIAPPFLIRHGLIAFGIVAAYATDTGMSASLAVAITLGAVLSSLIIQTAFVWARLRHHVTPGPAQKRIRDWFRTALPLVFVDGTLVLFSNADILILSLFVEPATIAIYFAASRILQLVAFVQYAATVATAQRFTALNALGDRKALTTLAQSTTRLTFIVSASAALGIYLIAPFLLSLFGDGFDAALPVLAILMAGLVIQALAGPGEDLLNMLGEERACAATFVVSLLVNVALNFALIPVLGIVGAALATAVSVGVRSLALTWLVHRRLGFHIFFLLGRREESA